MKRLLFGCIAALMLITFACKNSSKDSTIKIASPEDLKTFVYKIDNIADENISDTIWKMIFSMENGIDQISISQEDSTVVIKIDKTVYTENEILKEMEKRGAKNITRVN